MTAKTVGLNQGRSSSALFPLGEGGLYAAQVGGVGFHPFPGEGAASWGTAVKMIHETHGKKICVICVTCGHLFFIGAFVPWWQ